MTTFYLQPKTLTFLLNEKLDITSEVEIVSIELDPQGKLTATIRDKVGTIDDVKISEARLVNYLEKSNLFTKADSYQFWFDMDQNLSSVELIVDEVLNYTVRATVLRVLFTSKFNGGYTCVFNVKIGSKIRSLTTEELALLIHGSKSPLYEC